MLLASSPVYATTTLYDWAFNINGDTYEKLGGDPLPINLDDSSFNWVSGLGTFSLSFDTAGDYSVTAFFDHEIDEAVNTYYNEFGEVVGVPNAGQSWEIDEPEYVFGDIYSHVLAGVLDNTNGVPSGSEDDVSMALDWNFILEPNELALIDFALSNEAPNSAFYLIQTDPNSQSSVYLSSVLTIAPAPVPEPATILLLGGGLAGLAFGNKKGTFYIAPVNKKIILL